MTACRSTGRSALVVGIPSGEAAVVDARIHLAAEVFVARADVLGEVLARSRGCCGRCRSHGHQPCPQEGRRERRAGRPNHHHTSASCHWSGMSRHERNTDRTREEGPNDRPAPGTSDGAAISNGSGRAWEEVAAWSPPGRQCGVAPSVVPILVLSPTWRMGTTQLTCAFAVPAARRPTSSRVAMRLILERRRASPGTPTMGSRAADQGHRPLCVALLRRLQGR